MAKVRLYQDVDCCLNASFNARAWRTPNDAGTTDAGYRRDRAFLRHADDGTIIVGYEPHSYSMEWNTRLIDAMNKLDVELVWATTWRADAFGVGELMGLTIEDQRVLHPLNGQTTFPSIMWKYDAIMREQEYDPSPFIAVDDEWDSDRGYYRESLESIGGLVICPEPNLGVTPADIEKMERYIKNHA